MHSSSKIALAVILPGLALTLISSASAVAPNFVLRPGVSAGAVTRGSSAAQVKQRYGVNAFSRELDGPEGSTFPGLVIYPKNAAHKLEVILGESAARRVQQARVRGKSRWRTPEGVTSSISLRQLERINGAPFTFNGFDWDGGGWVMSWGKGKLRRYGQKLRVNLNPGNTDKLPPAQYEKVSGDRPLRSDNPIVRKLNVTVFEVSIDL